MPLSPVTMRSGLRGSLPQRIAGLGLWLDASVESSLTFNGNGVSEWRDISGNGRHFAQATAANQPDGVTRTQGGLRVLDFDGTKWLNGNAAARRLSRDVAGLTILCVQQRDSVVASRTLDMSTGGSATMSRVNLSVLTTPSNYIAYSLRRPDSEATGSSTFYAYDTDAAVVSGSLDCESAVGRIWKNGVLQHTNATLQTQGRTDDTDSAAVSIGALTTGTVGMDGCVGELIVYRRVLANAERERLEAWLLAKWSLT